MPQQIDTPAIAYPNLQFLPFKSREKARQIQVNLAPSTVFARGTVLGQVTSSANDVQTITISGTPTGGTWTYTAPNGQSLTPAYNVATATLQASLAAIYGANNIVVTGTAGASYVLTAAANLAGLPLALATVSGAGLTGGTTPAAAIAHTTSGRTAGTFKAYASGNSDGSQTARGILQNDCATDGAGMITFGPVAGMSRWGEAYLTAPMWVGGIFRTVLMTGWDSTARTSLGAHLETGTDADGIVVIP